MAQLLVGFVFLRISQCRAWDLRIDCARTVAAAGVNGTSEEISTGTTSGDVIADGFASEAGKVLSRGRFRGGVSIGDVRRGDVLASSLRTLAGASCCDFS